MPALLEVETARRDAAEMPLPGPYALGCLVLVLLGGRLLSQLDLEEAYLLTLGQELSYAVVLGSWAALAPHTVWLRAPLALVVAVAIAWTPLVDYGPTSAFGAILVTSFLTSVGVARRLSLRMTYGAVLPVRKPFRFSIGQLLAVTALAALACGAAAIAYPGPWQMEVEELPAQLFFTSLLLVLVLPALPTQLLMLLPHRRRALAASLLFSPVLSGLLATAITAASPYAESFGNDVTSLRGFGAAVLRYGTVAAGAQWMAVLGGAVLSWSGYRLVRSPASIGEH